MVNENPNLRPNIEEIFDFAMVEGTDESKNNPIYFIEASDHPIKKKKHVGKMQFRKKSLK